MTATGESRSRELPWLITFLILVMVAAATVWYPVIRTFANFEINYNEGWNAYRAKMAAAGVPLYGSAPHYTVTNYPPLSFHFIGLIGRVTGDFVLAGRCVSLVSVVLIGLLIAAIVHRFSGRWHAGSYAALSFVIWLAIFQPDRIGMDDPQLLATVFSLLGLYAYVADSGPSSRWLCVSALAFAVSVFTKHNLLAFPIAVGVHLSIAGSFRRFGIWAGVFAASAGALLLIVLRVDGPHFWSHLMMARPYSSDDAIAKVSGYVETFQIPAAAAIVWSLWNCANIFRNILAIAFVFAHAIAIAFAGGYGVDGNIFFDGMIALALILGVAAADLAEVVQNRRFGNALLAALLLAPLVGVVPLLYSRIPQDIQSARSIPAAEGDFTQAVGFLAAQPGPALCNNLLLCFEAGKEESLDTFMVSGLIGLGTFPENELLNLMDDHHFKVIQVEANTNSLLMPGKPMADFMKKLAECYRLGLKTGRYGILIPQAD